MLYPYWAFELQLFSIQSTTPQDSWFSQRMVNASPETFWSYMFIIIVTFQCTLFLKLHIHYFMLSIIFHLQVQHLSSGISSWNRDSIGSSVDFPPPSLLKCKYDILSSRCQWTGCLDLLPSNAKYYVDKSERGLMVSRSVCASLKLR